MKANYCHLTGGSTAAVLSLLSLVYSWHPLFSIVIIATTNLYVFLFFIECGLRCSDTSREHPRPKMFELPGKFWAPFQLFFLSFVFIPGFANLYIHTGAVVHCVSDKAEPSARYESGEAVERADKANEAEAQEEYLTDKVDAFYFSFVTIASLGYGDYVPASRRARCVVIWELFTTVQLILFAFPLIVSRLGNF